MSDVFTHVPLSSVQVGPEEERLAVEVLRSGMLAQGPMVARLEEEFSALIGVRHTVAVSNGTIALIAALESLGIGAGDEVITTAFSFNATLNAVLAVGAIARFADIGDDYTVDPDAMAALVTPRTAALLPVHLYGRAADMTAITALARRHGLAIVEDSAQAHGATHDGRAAGSYGVGTFSLYGTKNITCGEGGLVTTDDDAVADKLRVLRNQGMRRRYEYETVGHNWRLTDLQAAVVLPQVRRVQEIIHRRAANARRLTRGLTGTPGLVLPSAALGHVWHQYTVRLSEPLDRDRFCARLAENGVGHGIYYPRLMYDYDCYRAHPRVVTDPAPRARQAAARVVSLPVHPQLTDADLDHIITTVRSTAHA